MAEKSGEFVQQKPEQEPEKAPDVPDTSGIAVTSAKGKQMKIIKLETDSTPQPQIQPPEILAFKDRPIEHLAEASQREYEVEGEDIEEEYDDMTEEQVTKEVEKLTSEERAHYKELKDLLTIQGRLKGKIPTLSHLINTYVSGRYPGVPSDQVQQHIKEDPEFQDIQNVPQEDIDTFVREHDRRIPRRAIVRPGCKGISMSIDPYDDVEVYTIDEIEDTVVETVVLTDDPPVEQAEKSQGEPSETTPTGTQAGERETHPITRDGAAAAEPSTSKADRPVVTDMLTEEVAKEYVVENPDEDDAETISSTSTADYDRDEAEELINQIASCHSALATHYEKINQVVPHMSRTQLALYLGKVPVIPLVKPEVGHVTKMYVEEKPVDPKYDYEVRGHTWEEKLDHLVKTVPAEHLLFAIAIGDMQVNQFSQAHIAFKYGYAKTRIQRAMSHNPEHKKGGRQYQQERKRKETQTKEGEEPPVPAKKQTPIPQEVLEHTKDDELADLPTDEQGDVIFPEPGV